MQQSFKQLPRLCDVLTSGFVIAERVIAQDAVDEVTVAGTVTVAGKRVEPRSVQDAAIPIGATCRGWVFRTGSVVDFQGEYHDAKASA